MCVHENSPPGVAKEYYCLVGHAIKDNSTETYASIYKLFSEDAKSEATSDEFRNTFNEAYWQGVLKIFTNDNIAILTEISAESERQVGNLTSVSLNHPWIKYRINCEGAEDVGFSLAIIQENGQWKLPSQNEISESWGISTE